MRHSQRPGGMQESQPARAAAAGGGASCRGITLRSPRPRQAVGHIAQPEHPAPVNSLGHVPPAPPPTQPNPP